MNAIALLRIFALASGALGFLRAQESRPDYERAANLRKLTANKVFSARVNPHWLNGNTRFWYQVKTGPESHEYVLVDAEKGTRQAAFDHVRLAGALNAAGAKGARAERLALDNLEFNPPGAPAALGSFDFRCDGKGWRCDLATYKLEPRAAREEAVAALPLQDAPRASTFSGPETTLNFVNRTPGDVELFWLDEEGRRHSYGKLGAGEEREQHTYAGHVWRIAGRDGKALAVFQAQEEPGNAEIREGAANQAPAGNARRPRGAPRNSASPDGRWRAIVKDFNLAVKNVQSGEEITLSAGATDGDAYSDKVYWSPDSKKLAALRTKKGDQRKVYVVESSPATQLQPKLQSYDYLKPGDQIPLEKPHLFDLAAGMEIPVRDELFPNPWDISDVRWAADSSRFTFLYNQRGHQALRIVEVNAATGAARAIVDEQSGTFIDYAGKLFTQYLDATREIVWMSERDGWNHLYLYDAETGNVKNQITRGEWAVRGVERVDEQARQIWFRAGGIRPGQDPYFIHYCRVNFDGSGLVVLSEGNGTHSAQLSPDRRFFVDTWSRVDQPPVVELRRSDDGKLLCELERGDWSALLKTGWRAPEPFVAKGRDGTTDIYGVITRPTHFDANKKYPVIEDIYAGPQGAFSPKSFQSFHRMQELAELGFIVVQLDGMGTSHRSKKFHDACWKNLGDAGFPDRIAWIKAAARKYPCMDLSRVGIYGTSAGGQSALRALLAHGDFYKAAVADSGCHDNRMDKIWWNELWMGWPVGPHYDEQSNVTQAHKLTGKLLLLAGELDKNVDPASTMQVVNALIKANKDFDCLVVPGAGHGILGSPYGWRRLEDFFVRHLLGVELRH